MPTRHATLAKGKETRVAFRDACIGATSRTVAPNLLHCSEALWFVYSNMSIMIYFFKMAIVLYKECGSGRGYSTCVYYYCSTLYCSTGMANALSVAVLEGSDALR
jgi:hypothetical protein